MPVNVRLRFVAPYEKNLVKLMIYEGATNTGPWTQIDETTEIGSFPAYIDEFTTSLADAIDDWFSIDWEDDKGATLGLSQPIQGGTTSLVGEIVERILVRDPTISELVALQEVEAVVESYFGVDPYTLFPDDANYRIKRGLTLLALAKSWIFKLASGTTLSYTAGLISQTSGTSQSQQSQNIEDLIKEAEKDLGLSFSIICQMMDIEIAGGQAVLAELDQSRLLIEQP